MKGNFDAIVVGGGMTGSWAAMELCKAGIKTLLLERGPDTKHPEGYRHALTDPWDYPNRGLASRDDAALQPVQSQQYLYTDATKDALVDETQHPYTTPPDKPFDWLRSYRLGGRSLLWGRQSYRFSALDFAGHPHNEHPATWPLSYAELAPFYDDVERFVGISGQREGLHQLPDGVFQPPMPMNDMELLAREAIRRKWPDRLITIGRVANLTESINGRGVCINRNKCAQGCPWGGYYSALSGALPVARATGNLVIRCDAIVERIVYEKRRRRATGVRVIDANTHAINEYQAPLIFMCAGTLDTTRILLISAEPDGIGTSSNQLGHNLMDHHLISMRANIPNGPKTYYRGHRPTGTYMPRFRNLDGGGSAGFRGGYGFQFYIDRKDWRRGFLDDGFGAQWKDSLSHWGGWRVTLVGFGETLPYYDNHVSLNYEKRDAYGMPTLFISAEFKENEHAMNRDMLTTAKEIMQQLDCDEPVIFDKKSNPGRCIHEMGTARMGSDPATSVIDPWNRLWDAPNVIVTDGSAMVTSSSQNPSMTFLAITARAVRKAINDFKTTDI